MAVGTQGVIGEVMGGVRTISDGRLRVAIDDFIDYLDVDKSILLHLLSAMKKKSVGRMEHTWQTLKRKKDFVAGAPGGAWDGAAAASGTLTVATADAHLFSIGDLVSLPEVSLIRNLYVTSVVLSTGVVTLKTVDGANITLSDASNQILLISNSFESGGGVGTIKTEQPVEESNFVQIVQTPVGITTTAQHLEYRGVNEWDRIKFEAGVDHAFKLEKALFLGQKNYEATGLMDGNFEQWMMGGCTEYISTNTDTQAEITEDEFSSWITGCSRYAVDPMIMAGELIFEALTAWAQDKVQLVRNEDTLGIAITKYVTPRGKAFPIVPHLELLTDALAGVAFSLDIKDLEYRYLQGLDTHVEVDVQTPGYKQKIDEMRTWLSMKMGNEVRHGMLDGVQTIGAAS